MYNRDILWKYKIEGRGAGDLKGSQQGFVPVRWCFNWILWNWKVVVVISLNTQIAKFCSNSKSWAWKCLVYRDPRWVHGRSPACVVRSYSPENMNESYLEVCWGVDLLRHRGTWDLGVVGSVGLGCILASQDGSHRERGVRILLLTCCSFWLLIVWSS